MVMNPDNFSGWLAETAKHIGAHSAACLRLDNPLMRDQCAEQQQRTSAWLDAGLHGAMDYLARLQPDRYSPWTRFSFARSVIILTFANRWSDPAATHPFPAPPADALLGYVSSYVRTADYHTTGRGMLDELARRLGHDIHCAATVDTGPVDERLLAIAGGLGIQGGNNLLRLPDLGTRVFIGCLFVELELPEVIAETQFPFACDDCRACARNCPTGALTYGEQFDARQCISYLTIEKPGLLTHAEGESIGAWLFGCDNCTAVCPPAVADLRIPVDLEWLLTASSGDIARIIKGTAMAYAGVTRLRRNAVAILKNQNSPRALALLDRVARTTGSELIREQIAAW